MNVGPLRRTVTINNPNGLHMRPSAAFASLAWNFQSDVIVRRHDGYAVNGKSPLDIMTLAAEPGSELVLEVEGPDAAEALEALAECLGALPPPLPD
jgi:phosphotransferase system HPr (HPr) family protein